MSETARPICYECKNFHKSKVKFTCNAFPDGIPDGIIENEIDHRKPVKGDHAIRFDPKTPEGEDYARRIFAPKGK